MGITLPEFNEFSELPALIIRAFNSEISGLSEAQRALFPRLYSWDAVRGSWLSLYGKLARA